MTSRRKGFMSAKRLFTSAQGTALLMPEENRDLELPPCPNRPRRKHEQDILLAPVLRLDPMRRYVWRMD